MAKEQIKKEKNYSQEFDELLSNEKVKKFIIALGQL